LGVYTGATACRPHMLCRLYFTLEHQHQPRTAQYPIVSVTHPMSIHSMCFVAAAAQAHVLRSIYPLVSSHAALHEGHMFPAANGLRHSASRSQPDVCAGICCAAVVVCA
jgi:hypothetical protein